SGSTGTPCARSCSSTGSTRAAPRSEGYRPLNGALRLHEVAQVVLLGFFDFELHRVRTERFGIVFRDHTAEVAQAKSALRSTAGGGADRDLARSSEVQKPRRNAGRLTDGGVIAAQTFADDADSDWACVDANPNPKVYSVSMLHVGPK